jgi:hypothetical protein
MCALKDQKLKKTGEYDLEALFIRLNHAIESVGAKTGGARYNRVIIRRHGKCRYTAVRDEALFPMVKRKKYYNHYNG